MIYGPAVDFINLASAISANENAQKSTIGKSGGTINRPKETIPAIDCFRAVLASIMSWYWCRSRKVSI